MSRIRPSKGLDDFIPSGSLLTGAADVYTAPPETPASRDKLIQPFSRQNTECVPWFASFCQAQNDFWFILHASVFTLSACGLPPWRNAMDFRSGSREGAKVKGCDPRDVPDLQESECHG
jgi:hypothetical protein